MAADAGGEPAGECRIGHRGEQIARASRGLIGEMPAADDRQPFVAGIEDAPAEAPGHVQCFHVRVVVGQIRHVGGGVEESHCITRDTQRANPEIGRASCRERV